MEAKMATDLGPVSEDHDPDEGARDAGVEEHEDYSEHDLDAPIPHERPV
jgi:hypothetical protein